MRTIIGFLTTLFVGTFVFAQEATVIGTVRDQTQAVTPGVAITAVNVNTALTRDVLTNDAGNYTVPNLPVGTYRITAELPGFSTQVAENIKLDVQQTVRIDFQLQVGQVTQEVSVTGIGEQLQTDDVQVSTVIENKLIIDLPLNGRNFTQLNLLVAGVVESTPGAEVQTFLDGRGAGVGFSVHGQRSAYNNYLLDGVTVKENQSQTNSVSPSIDAIQEFRVQTSNYDSEFGSEAGGQINIVTKSGTNEWHGTVYNFHRNDNLDAKNFFAPEKPEFKRNQFGATLGGPVVRDEFFIFGSYEGARILASLTQQTTVPDAKMRAGDFSDLLAQGIFIQDPLTGVLFPGNIIPPGRLNPISTSILDEFVPLPNQPGQALNWISTESTPINTDQFIVKSDWEVSEKVRISGRYIFEDVNNESAKLFPTDSFSKDSRAQNLAFSYTHTISPSLLNHFRFSYNRFTQDELVGRAFTRNVVGELGIKGLCTEDPACWGLPEMQVSGFATFAEHGQGQAVSGPRGWENEIFSFSDTVSTVKGAHSLKLGMQVERLFDDFVEAIFPRGIFGFDGQFSNPAGVPSADTSLADFLLGFSRNNTRSIDIFAPDFRSWALHPWIQDTWRIRDNLTVNLGLRYEYFGRPVSKTNTISTIDFGATPVQLVTAIQAEAGEVDFPRGLTDGDSNNFAPRVGFAWTPGSQRKFVVRSGYGIFYQREAANTWIDIAINPPFIEQTAFTLEPGDLAAFSLSDPFALAARIPLLTFGIDRQWKDPYIQQWHLNLQYQLAPTLLVEAGYVGNKGTNLPTSYDINQAIPGPGDVQDRRPFPNFGTILFLDTSAFSAYHGLELQAQKRFSEGLSFLLAYTWGKAMANSERTFTGERALQHQNVRNRNADKSLAAMDVRQRFSGSFLYELPFESNATGLAKHLISDWQIGAIITLRSGQPFTIGASGDLPGVGSGDIRADLVGDPDVGNSSVERFFNTDAFKDPAPGSFGNSGRNIVVGPGFETVDFTIVKDFAIDEELRIQFRAEFFNLFNHPNFPSMGTTVGTPSFGQLTSASEGRDIQLGLKIIF